MTEPDPSPSVTTTSLPDPESGPVLLWGIELRSWLVLTLEHHRGPLRVRDLLGHLHAEGFAVSGRPSKTLSDALRWETRRGRAIRCGHNHYRAGHVPKSTRSRMRARIARCRTTPTATPITGDTLPSPCEPPGNEQNRTLEPEPDRPASHPGEPVDPSSQNRHPRGHRCTLRSVAPTRNHPSTPNPPPPAPQTPTARDPPTP